MLSNTTTSTLISASSTSDIRLMQRQKQRGDHPNKQTCPGACPGMCCHLSVPCRGSHCAVFPAGPLASATSPDLPAFWVLCQQEMLCHLISFCHDTCYTCLCMPLASLKSPDCPASTHHVSMRTNEYHSIYGLEMLYCSSRSASLSAGPLA